MERKVTGTSRSLECYPASTGKMHFTYDYQPLHPLLGSQTHKVFRVWLGVELLDFHLYSPSPLNS